MAVRVGINGFGRIGRNFFRAAFGASNLEIAAINDLYDAQTLSHLLKYDSIQGIFERSVEGSDKSIAVDGKTVLVTAERDPKDIPWGDMEVDYVLESSGLFKERTMAQRHMEAGARKVVISAPAKNPDVTICMGINHELYDPLAHNVISNASCTTNCLAPVAKVLMENFGIVRGFMTTIHAVTNDQSVLDIAHKDLRRARSASASMIPTSTGAASAIHLVLPELEGRMDGLAVRVPVETVSLVDLVVETERRTEKEEVNAAFEEAAHNGLRGILGYSELPLVSVDFKRDPRSAVVDALSTRVVEGKMVGVLAWYDNEWGYSCRLKDLMEYMITS